MKKRAQKKGLHERAMSQKMRAMGLSIDMPQSLAISAAVPAIADALAAVSGPAAPVDGPSTSPQEDLDVVDRTLAAIATNAWRAKKKMVDSTTGEPLEEMKKVYRHIESIFNALQEADVKLLEPTGRNYDPGMAIRVLSFEPTPGIAREEIKDTIKPAILRGGRLIQAGEVIVGTPQAANQTTDKGVDHGTHDN